MRLLPYIAALSICPVQVPADDGCAKRTIQLARGEHYRIQRVGSSKIRRLRYERSYAQGEHRYAEFSDEQIPNVLIKHDDIFGTRPEPTKSDPDTKRVLDSLTHALATDSRLIARIMATPYFRLASSPGIEVLGLSPSLRKLAESITASVDAFDQTIDAMGFHKPASTRIIVAQKASKKFPESPSSFRSRIPNFWRARAESLIFIQPVPDDDRIIRSEDVLLHERAHSIFYRNYSPEAYVNQNPPLTEALADFITAHHTDSPQLYDIRDIEKRASFYTNNYLGSLVQLTDDEHDNSLFLSHVLWKLRSELGTDPLAHFFKPFVENLNLYRQSFEEAYETSGYPPQRFLDDFEYFLAVLSETGRHEGMPSVRSVVDEAIADLALDPSRIYDMASKIEPRPGDFAYDPSSTSQRLLDDMGTSLGAHYLNTRVVLPWFTTLAAALTAYLTYRQAHN